MHRQKFIFITHTVVPLKLDIEFQLPTEQIHQYFLYPTIQKQISLLKRTIAFTDLKVTN